MYAQVHKCSLANDWPMISVALDDPNRGGSFRPSFKGGSFWPDCRGESFAPVDHITSQPSARTW